MFRLEWDDNSISVDSIQKVEKIFDDLHNKFSARPTLVTVKLPESGDFLSIGLGGDISVLNFVKGDKYPPYFTSVGKIAGEESLEFSFGGELSEYDRRNGIPITVAREVMRYFLETGKLSSLIAWEEV